MRQRVVLFEAVFAAVLATCLLLGAAFGSLDGDDFPAPASTGVTAATGFALMIAAWALLEAVSRDLLTDRIVHLLAACNLVLAVVLIAWGLSASGFSTVGHLTVWISAAALLLLALLQAGVRTRA